GLERASAGEMYSDAGSASSGHSIDAQTLENRGLVGHGPELASTGEAEGVGFEPTGRRSRPTGFKTVPIDHPGTPPEKGGGLGAGGERSPVLHSRRWPPAPGPRRSHSLLAHLVEDIVGDEDGDVHGDGQRDRVARPGIDLDDLPIMADPELGEVGVLTQFV